MAAGSNNIVTDGLISCWDAGNRRSYPGAGTTWTDVVGGNEGTLENMDTGGFDSQKGGVIEFDGTDDYVDTGSNQILPDGKNPFTISLWLKPESGGDDWNSLYMFKQDYNPDGTDERSFQVQWLTRAGISSSFYCGVRGLVAWGPAENIGADREDWYDKWCCVTVTYNGEGTKSGHVHYRLYINDVNYALGNIGSQGGTTNLNRLGVNHTSSFISKFKGAMANLSVWNRALSADEVSQNYEALKPRFEPRITKSGLVGNWDAGDPQSYNGGTIWKDTANHYDGTLENDGDGSLTFDSANGGSLVFDGTDDYVGPIAIGDYSGTARSVIIWAAADSYAQSSNDEFSVFNSASDKFSASLGLSNHFGYFYFKSKMTHTSTYQWGVASTSLVAGSWHCWAVTINASDQIVAVYQDGESKTSGSSRGMYFKDDTYIGARMNNATVERSWNGKIGTVRLYTKTLSAAEILDNYNKTKARFGH